MFFSPLCRILLMLTLVASAVAFACLDDSGGIPRIATGAALTLLVATVGRLVSESSVSDDRAFHRTRPGGERIALRRNETMLGGLAAALAGMAAIRCGILNLGWKAAGWGALLALLEASRFILLAATVTNLCLMRRNRVRTVIGVAIGVPVALVLFTIIVPAAGRWTDPAAFMVRGHELTAASLIGAVGYGIAWILASRGARGEMALGCVALVNLLIPFVALSKPLTKVRQWPVPEIRFTGSLDVEPRLAELERTFHFFLESEEKGTFKSVRLEGLLRAEGLGEDEFVVYQLRIAGKQRNRSVEFVNSKIAGWSGTPGILRPDAGKSGKTGNRSLMTYLAGKLDKGKSGFDFQIRTEESWARIPAEAGSGGRDWKIDGFRCRMKVLGSFPVRGGGFFPLENGGIMRAWPPLARRAGMGLDGRLILPELPEVPDFSVRNIREWMASPSIDAANSLWAVLVDEGETKAKLVPVRGNRASVGDQKAFGSRWSDLHFDLTVGDFPGWSETEIVRSRIHLFESRPLARIHVVLPSP